MQRRYNSVEKFTEMHLTTETIVETNGEVVSHSRENQTMTSRSQDNLLNPELQYHSPSPTNTVVQTGSPLTAGANNQPHFLKNNNSRPSSSTTFYPKSAQQQEPEQQQQQAQFLPYPVQPLSPIIASNQPAGMRSAQPYGYPPPDQHGGPNPSEARFGPAPQQQQQQQQPQTRWRTESTADSQRPGSSINVAQPRQQYYQQQQPQPFYPSQQQQQPYPPQQQPYQPLPPQQQQQFYPQPLSPQQQQQPYGVQTAYGKQPIFQNGPLNGNNGPAPTMVRYQQPATTASQPSYSVQRTPSRSALSKSRESVAGGGDIGSSSGETLQFAEHLDAFLENNVPGSMWIVFAVLQILFGLVSLFIAVFNFNLCYAEPKIPVYLLLSGLILIVNGSVRLCLRIPSSSPPTRIVVVNGRRYKQPVAENKKRGTFAIGGFVRYALEGTILFVMLAILILGCIWVYGARYVQFERYRFERNYCEYTLYWVSWWSVTGHLVVFSIFIVTVITVLLFGAVMSK